MEAFVCHQTFQCKIVNISFSELYILFLLLWVHVQYIRSSWAGYLGFTCMGVVSPSRTRAFSQNFFLPNKFKIIISMIYQQTDLAVLYYIILVSVLWMFTFNFKFCILYSSWGFLLCRMICIKISPQSSISRILQSLLFYLDGVIRGRSIQHQFVYILFMFNWAFVHFRIVLISVELI